MTAALQVDGLRKSFGGVDAITDVSFTVPPATATALIGPNGAGKTTVFNLVTHLFPATAGSIAYFGQPLVAQPPERIAGMGLIRTFQTARVFPGMTVLENVLAGAHLHLSSSTLAQMLWAPRVRREEARLRARAEALLDVVGLLHVADRAANDLPMGGQKLLEIVRALMARPRLLLLDEPAAGLNDSETAELSAVLRAIRATGITLLVVEHNMGLVMDVADQVVVLDAGRIVAAGTPAQIQSDPAVIEAYVGRLDR